MHFPLVFEALIEDAKAEIRIPQSVYLEMERHSHGKSFSPKFGQEGIMNWMCELSMQHFRRQFKLCYILSNLSK